MKATNISYVYLFCDPSQNLFKIGVTRNLYSKRMKQLQTGNGTELHLVNFHETFYPFTIEKHLHLKFQNKREHGEWFKLNTDDIKEFTSICERYEGYIESMKDNPFFIKNLH